MKVTPAEQIFCDSHKSKNRLATQVILLQFVLPTLSKDAMIVIWNVLADCHGSLLFNFEHDEEGWKRKRIPLNKVDSVIEEVRSDELLSKTNKAQGELFESLSGRCLFHILLSSQRSDALVQESTCVILLHHVCVDGGSIPILIADFDRLIDQYLNGEELFVHKGVSFLQYVDYLQNKHTPVKSFQQFKNMFDNYHPFSLEPAPDPEAPRPRKALTYEFEDLTTLRRLKSNAGKLSVSSAILAIVLLEFSKRTGQTEGLLGLTIHGKFLFVFEALFGGVLYSL
jgi:Condensation domain